MFHAHACRLRADYVFWGKRCICSHGSGQERMKTQMVHYGRKCVGIPLWVNSCEYLCRCFQETYQAVADARDFLQRLYNVGKWAYSFSLLAWKSWCAVLCEYVQWMYVYVHTCTEMFSIEQRVMLLGLRMQLKGHCFHGFRGLWLGVWFRWWKTFFALVWLKGPNAKH